MVIFHSYVTNYLRLTLSPRPETLAPVHLQGLREPPIRQNKPSNHVTSPWAPFFDRVNLVIPRITGAKIERGNSISYDYPVLKMVINTGSVFMVINGVAKW